MQDANNKGKWKWGVRNIMFCIYNDSVNLNLYSNKKFI